MKEKIRQKLTLLFSHKRLSPKAMDRLVEHYATLTIKDEELDTVLAGASIFVDLIQSETDSLRTETAQLKTENETLKTAAEKAKTPEPEKSKEDEKEKPSAIPKEFTDFMDQMKTAMQTMQGQVTGMQQKSAAETRLASFKQAMTDAKIPEAFYSGALLGKEFKDDAEVSSLIDHMKTNHATFTSTETADAASKIPPPITGKVDATTGISSLMAGYLADKKQQTEAAKVA